MPNLVRGVNELSAGFGAATVEGILRIHGLAGFVRERHCVLSWEKERHVPPLRF